MFDRKRLSRLLNAVSNDKSSEEKSNLSSSNSSSQLKLLRASRVTIAETRDTTPRRSRPPKRSQRPTMEEIQSSPYFSARKSRSLSPVRMRPLLSRDTSHYEPVASSSLRNLRVSSDREDTINYEMRRTAKLSALDESAESSKVDLALFTTITSDISKKILTIDNCQSSFEIRQKLQEIQDLSNRIGLKNFVLFLRDEEGDYDSFSSSVQSKHLPSSFVQQHLLTSWKENMQNQTAVFTHIERGFETIYDLLAYFHPLRPLEVNDQIIIDYFCESAGERNIRDRGDHTPIKNSSDFSTSTLRGINAFAISLISEEMEIPFFPFAGFIANNIKDMQLQVQKLQFHTLAQGIYQKLQILKASEKQAQIIVKLNENMNETQDRTEQMKLLQEQHLQEKNVQLSSVEGILALNIFLNTQENLTFLEANMAIIKTMSNLGQKSQSSTSSSSLGGARAWIIYIDKVSSDNFLLRLINNSGVTKTLTLNNKRIISTFLDTEEDKQISSPSSKPKFAPQSIDLTEAELIHWIGSNGGDSSFFLKEEKLSLLRVKIPLLAKDETILMMHGGRYECLFLFEYSKPVSATLDKGACSKYLSEISFVAYSVLRKILLQENERFQLELSQVPQMLHGSLTFESIDMQLIQTNIEVLSESEISATLDQFAFVNQQIASRIFSIYPQLISLLGAGSMKLLLSKNLLLSLGIMQDSNQSLPREDEKDSENIQSLNDWYYYQFQQGGSSAQLNPSLLQKYSIFNTANAESLLQQLLSSTMSNSWLKDLLNEKIVIFNPGNDHQTLLMQGITSNIQTTRGGTITSLVDPRLSLLQFIDNIDKSCTSSLILPINTNYGMAMLVLLDRKDNFWKNSFPQSLTASTASTSLWSANDNGFFNLNYAERLQQTGLIATIKSSFHQCVEVSNLLFRSILTSSTLSREKRKHQYIMKQLIHQNEEMRIRSTFLRWKGLHHRVQLERDLAEKKQWNDFILDLVQYRLSTSSLQNINQNFASLNPLQLMGKLLDAFFQLLEVHLGKFYPQDSIILLQKPSSSSLSPLSIEDHGNEELYSIINKPHIHSLHETIRFQGNGNSEASAFMKLLPDTLAHIIITRPKSNKRFSEIEEQRLKDISAVASVIYSALRMGFFIEMKEVDVIKEVTIPMFDHLLPILLSILDPNNDNLEDIFYAVIQWLKRMTEAEVVLLKINNSSVLSDTPSNAPWMLSSSDTRSKENVLFEKASMNSFLLPSKICKYSLITEASSPVYSLHPALPAAGQSSSKIVDIQIANPNEHEAFFGEMKLILTSSSSVSSSSSAVINELINPQKQKIIELMMSLLMQTISIRQDRTHKGKEHHSIRERLTALHRNFEIIKEELKQSQTNTEVATSDTFLLMKLCSLSSQLIHSYQWSQIADQLWRALPEFLQSASVLFAVNKDFLVDQINELIDVEAALIPSSEEYKIIWPSSATAPGSNFDTSNSYLSLSHLLNLPRYFNQPSASQSAILLTIPGSKKVFAAFLVFRDLPAGSPRPPVNSANSEQLVHSLEKIQELFTSLMSGILYQSANKFHTFLKVNYLQDQVQLLDQERLSKYKILENKDLIEKDKEKLQLEIIQLEEKLEKLQIEKSKVMAEKNEIIDQLHQEQEDLKNHADEELAKSAESIKQLDQVNHQLQQEIESVQLNKANVLDLVVKFAYDDRCQPESVLSWLEEVASTRHASVLYFTSFSQEYSLPEVYQKINGLWAAIGEASRTGKSIRFEASTTDALTPNLSVVGIHATRGGNSKLLKSRSSSSKSLYGGSDKVGGSSNITMVPQLYDIFCVPNRSILQPKSIEKYCFIFLKPLGDKYHPSYTDEDIDILETAANLSSRLLAKSVSEITNDEYLGLEKEFQSQRSELQRIISVLQYAKELFYSQEIKSEGELWKLLRSSITEFFSSKESSNNSPVICDCELFTAERLSKHQQKIYQRYPPTISHLIELAKAQFLPQRDQNIIVIPISANREFYGVLVIEKKIKPNLPSSSSNPVNNTNVLNETAQAALSELSNPEAGRNLISGHRGNAITVGSSMDLSVLLMNRYDEVVASVLSNYCTSILDKIFSVKDAFLSIQTASQAVVAVQESKVHLEGRLAIEISYRLQYEESVKAGLDFLAMACTHRMSIGQLSDLMKKSMLSLTTGADAFILLPYHCEALTTELLVELNEDPHFSSSFVPPKTSSPIFNGYYTFLPESPYPVFVHLEEGDMESVAIQNFRPIFLPPESTQNRDLNFALRGWQSWAFRKSNLWSRGVHLDMHNKFSTGNDPHANLYAMSVPFRLSNGSHDLIESAKPVGVSGSPYPLNSTALIVLVRKNIPFTHCDLECISWLGQTLSYCFSLKSDKFATKNRLVEHKSIQKEVIQLRSQLAIYQRKEEDYFQIFMNMKEIQQLIHLFPSSGEEIMQIIKEEGDKRSFNEENESSEKLMKSKSTGVDEQIVTVFTNQEQQYFLLALQLVFHSAKILECSENEWSDFMMPPMSTSPQKFSGHLHPFTAILPTSMQGNAEYPYKIEMVIAEFGKITFKFGQLSEPTAAIQTKRSRLARSRSRDEHGGRGPSFIPNGGIDDIDAIILKVEKTAISTKSGPLKYYVIHLKSPTTSTTINSDEDSIPFSDEELVNLDSDYEEIHQRGQKRKSQAAGKAKPGSGAKGGFIDLSNIYFKLELFYHYLLFYLSWKKEIISLYQYIIQIRFEKLQEKQSYVNELVEKSSAVSSITNKYEIILQQEKANQQQMMTRQKLKSKQAESSFYEIFTSMSVFVQHLYAAAIQTTTPSTQRLQMIQGVLEKFVQAQSSMNVGADYFSGLLSTVDFHEEKSGLAPSRPPRNIAWTSPRGAAHLVTSFLTSGEPLLDGKSIHLLLFLDEEFEGKYGITNVFENILTSLRIPSELLAITIIAPSTFSTNASGIGGGNKLVNAIVLLLPPDNSSFGHGDNSWLVFGINLETKVSKSIYRQAILYLIQLAYIFTAEYTLRMQHHNLREMQEELTVKKLLTIQQQKELEKLREEVSLKSISLTTQTEKLQNLQSKQQKLALYRQKSLFTDQLIADLTELVKGLNGSSSSIIGGSKGVWARSCSTLLSVISSHCTVQNCGLILPKDVRRGERKIGSTEAIESKKASHRRESMNNLTEYVVRNITTPLPQNKKKREPLGPTLALPSDYQREREEEGNTAQKLFDQQQVLEYAKANLQAQNVEDYGNKVYSVVLDIVDGPISKIQRIYRLNAAGKSGGSQATASYIYLIPIKTAVEVLGVLHIQTEFSLSLDPFETSKLQETVDQQSSSLAMSDAEIMSLVENNLVYFSDLFASFMNAANAIDDLQIQTYQKDLSIQSKEETEQQLAKEVASMNHNFHHLKHINQLLTSCFEESIITEDVIFSIDQFILTVNERLSKYLGSSASVSPPVSPVTSISSPSSLNRCSIVVNKDLLAKMDEFWFQEDVNDLAGTAMSARSGLGYYQEIHQKFFQKHQSLLAAEESKHNRLFHHFYEELKFPLTPAGVKPFKGTDEGENSYFMVGYVSIMINASEPENSDSHLAASLDLTMKVLSHLLSTMLMSVVKESIAKKKVTVAVDTIREIQKGHKAVQQSYDFSKFEHTKSLQILEEQKKWIQLLTNALEGLSIPTSEAQRNFYSTLYSSVTSVTSFANVEELHWKNQLSFLKYLEKLIQESISLLNSEGSTNLYQMNCILLPPKVIASKQLVWIYGPSFMSSNLSWNALQENTRTMIMNLVNNCIEKRKKLSVELRQIMDGEGDVSTIANLRIDVVPFLNSYTSEVIGVLQFTHLLPSAQQQSGTVNASLAQLDETFSLDELDHPSGTFLRGTPGDGNNKFGMYTDFGSLFSRIVTSEITSLLTRSSYEQTEAKVINVSTKQEVLSIQHSYNLYYQEAWKVFCNITTILSGQLLLLLLPSAGSRPQERSQNFLSDFLLAVTNFGLWQAQRRKKAGKNKGRSDDDGDYEDADHSGGVMEILLPLLQTAGMSFILHEGNSPPVTNLTLEEEENILARSYLPLLPIDDDIVPSREEDGRKKSKQGLKRQSVAQYLEIQIVKNQTLHNLEVLLNSAPLNTSDSFGKVPTAALINQKEIQQQVHQHANEYLDLFITFFKSLLNLYYEKKNFISSNSQQINELQSLYLEQQQQSLQLSQQNQQLVQEQQRLSQDILQYQEIALIFGDSFSPVVKEVLHTDYMEWKYHLQELTSLMTAVVAGGGTAASTSQAYYEKYYFMLLQLLNQRLIKLFIHPRSNSSSSSASGHPSAGYPNLISGGLMASLSSRMKKKLPSILFSQKNHSPILKYHISVLTLLPQTEETEVGSNTKDSFKVRMYDQNQDKQDLTIIHYNAIQRFVKGNAQPFSTNTIAMSERQSLVEKAFEINSVFFEESYSNDNRETTPISMTDLIGIQDPDYHYSIFSHQKTGSSASEKKRLQITVMTIGMKYSESASSLSKSKRSVVSNSGNNGKTSHAVLRIVLLHESSPNPFIKVKGESELKGHAIGEEFEEERKSILSEKSFIKCFQQYYLDYETSLLFHHVKNICITFFSYSEMIFQMSQQHHVLHAQQQHYQTNIQEDQEKFEQLKSLSMKYRKIYKHITREANKLLDPPLIGPVGGALPRAIHPANLTPLAASQDTCLKLLSLLRSLLKTEGQALMLKDTTTNPETYQVIYTGDAITWPGIEQNSFGVITSPLSAATATGQHPRASLIESVFFSRKSLVVPNAPVDDRYVSRVDGILSLGTSLMVIPLRGRGGSIVGVISLAKYIGDENTPVKATEKGMIAVDKRKTDKKGVESTVFSDEDLIMGELMSNFGSLSLYWCQGLGSLHHQLHKTVNKLDKLEKMIHQQQKIQG